MVNALNKYKAISFDCYGTLIDWETGIWDAAQILLMKNLSAKIDKDLFLTEFAYWETELEKQNPAMPYPELLTEVHKSIAKKYSLAASSELSAAFGHSVSNWPAFGDTADSLRKLQTRVKLFILSNVDRESFAKSNTKLGVEFADIYTAEDIGSYKPNPQNFVHMITKLKNDHGIKRTEILHTAQSLHHDLLQAEKHGLDTAWIDRQRLSKGGKWGATAEIKETVDPNFVFFSMSEMVNSFLNLN